MDDKIHKYIAISSFGEVTLYKDPSDENSKILGGKPSLVEVKNLLRFISL